MTVTVHITCRLTGLQEISNIRVFLLALHKEKAMPRQFSMTWNKIQKRWFKKAAGKQYAVSCRVLRQMYPDLIRGDTEESSYRAAIVRRLFGPGFWELVSFIP